MRHSRAIYFIAILTMITGPALFAQNPHSSQAGLRSLHKDSSWVIITDLNTTLEKGKVSLNWVAGNNQAADRFEVERSTNSKTFVMAALVFAAEQPGSYSYRFFEKKVQQVSYRIKIIQKNGSINYSSVTTRL